ncbi:MAG TPA: type II secretion system protein GspL [Geobacteraceae bacterium]|nr:type II secretion system protein GspL [Geobacteraceae bacterium]
MNYLIVQLSADEAVFARFKVRGKELVFVEASRDAIDEERPFTAMLADIKARASAEEKVVLAIPPALLFMREIELPIAERRKVREILPLEMKGETAVDTDELVFDALPLEGGKSIAIWCKREKVAGEIRSMTGQGLEPAIVTASLFHWHALLPDKASADPVALTDGEAVAVYRNGLPVYFRPLGSGEMATEVSRTLAALEITKGIKVDTVYLHGSAARKAAAAPLANVPDGLTFTILPVGAELAATFPSDSTAATDLAGAFALARACSSDEPVDFRRGDLAYTAGLVQTRRKLRLPLCLAAAFAVLLFAEAGTRYFLVTRDLNSLNTSVRSIFREVFPTRKKSADEVAELRSEIKRLSGAAAVHPILPVLKKLAELKGDDISGIYETEIEGGQVRLKGDARSVQGVNDFKSRAAVVFAGAEVGEVKSRPDGSVSFVFKATIKEGEK